MEDRLRLPVKKLLAYSFKNIDWQYSGLTDGEKKCITREEYKLLKEWVKNEKVSNM